MEPYTGNCHRFEPSAVFSAYTPPLLAPKYRVEPSADKTGVVQMPASSRSASNSHFKLPSGLTAYMLLLLAPMYTVPSLPIVGDAPLPMPLAPPPPPPGPCWSRVSSGVGPRCSPKLNDHFTWPDAETAYMLPSEVGM